MAAHGDVRPDQKGRSDWQLTSAAAIGNFITGEAKSGSIPPESAQETSDRIRTMRPGSGLRVRDPGLVARYGSIYALLVSGPAGASKDLIRFGSRSIANSSARAGASGTDRRCSQSRSVVSGRWNASANSRCVRPIRWRSALTREMRRILEICALVKGAASGSARAALRTSESDIEFRRFQSVAPGRSPDFAVTSVGAVFFMFRSLAGRNDAAGIFIAIGDTTKRIPPLDIPMTRSRASP